MDDLDDASPGPAMDDPDAASLEAAKQAPITVWLGPVGPLLRKLRSLMASGGSLQDRLSADQIRRLGDGLKKLCICLKDMSEDEKASFMARWWMKLVRELCYDTEDHLDEVCGPRPCPRAHQDFSELLARAKYASERRNSFHWTKPDYGEADVSRLTSQMSPELLVPLGGHSTVGLVEPLRKLVELLALDEKTLKVICIHGCAGVGKSTVARTLYHKHGGKFQCRAFVTLSRNPDMRLFLTGMLSQLKAPRPHGFADVPDLIDAINKHLQDKRYFMVIDNLWSASIWDIISRAFCRGDYCSRIITTTENYDAALACRAYNSDYIYKMKPLNDYESRKLFFGKVFGSEDGCPTDFKEVSYEIIRKCGGLPLAIVNLASMLASESNMEMEKWKHIQDSLPSTSEGMNPPSKNTSQRMKLRSKKTSEGMKVVLNLIFSSLPPRLRTCLLYFSMYAQGYVIKKDELLKQWVAEGFLGAVGGRDTKEIAEGYFDELVCRGMVQAVDTNNNGEVLSCTVHQMVLDFIRHKSMEENFIITVDYFQSTLALPDKVRRLSVQFGGVKSAYIPETIVTSQVRSLIFWGFFKCVPSSFMDYGLLRILILHIWADEDNESFDLTGIGELFLLKYVKIECNITVELPDKIRRLQHLGTLQVDARLSAVPSDIVRLERLLHLHLLSESILPSVVGHLTSLRTLGYFDISSHSEENVMHLGELTNLQDLQLTCSTVQPAENLEKNVQLLGSILEKLSVLQSVSLVPAASGSSYVNIPQDDAWPLIPRDGFGMVSPPPTLERLELSRHCWIFSSLPEWIGDLDNLRILKIAVGGLSREDIDVLKGLSSLTTLTLYIQTAPAERIVINKEGFQVLTYFKFMCAAPCLSFVRGAMPNVQKLALGFNSNKMKPHCLETAGFRHLTGLIEISVKFGVWAGDKFDRKAAESALEAAVSNHPNSPIIRVQHVDVIFDGGEDKSTTTEGKEEKLQEIQDAHASSGPAMDDPDAASLQAAMQLPRRVTRPATSVMLQVLGGVAASTQFSGGVPPRRRDGKGQVCSAVLGAVVPSLGKLLTYEWGLYKTVKDGLTSLQDELCMHAFLGAVAGMPPDQLESQVQLWAHQIRELSHAIETRLHSFMARIELTKDALLPALRKWRINHEIDSYIKDTRIKVKELRDRHGEYPSKSSLLKSTSTQKGDTRIFATYTRESNPVGIDGAIDELITKLYKGDRVSIVGMMGMGKTTLARAVYDKMKRGYDEMKVGFDCGAFVHFGQNADANNAVKDIFCGLHMDLWQGTKIILANRPAARFPGG